MHQPAPGKLYDEANIIIKVIKKFTYLGSTLSKSIVMDDEVNTFGRLKKIVWNRRDLSEAIKIKVYLSVIHTTLIYGCEM